MQMDCFEDTISRMVIGPTTIRMEFDADDVERVVRAAQHHMDLYRDYFLFVRSWTAYDDNMKPVKRIAVTFTRPPDEDT